VAHGPDADPAASPWRPGRIWFDGLRRRSASGWRKLVAAVRRHRPGPILALAGLVMAVHVAIALNRYATYQLGFDLALFGESVREYSQFQAPLSTIKSSLPFNMLGDHFTPILTLLAPIYRLIPDIRVLLVAQAFLFALTAAIIGLWAARRIGRGVGMLVTVAFGLSWGIVHALLFDFHEVAFATPLLALALIALRQERWGWLWVCVVLLWLTKEDTTFVTAGLGLLLLTRRRWLQGLALGAASLGVFLVLVRLVIPWLSQSGVYTYFDVVESSPWSVLASHLFNPTFATFAGAVALVAGVGLSSPVMVVLAPLVLSRLVSTKSIYFELQHHYHVLVMVVCFMALIEAWEHWRSKLRPWAARLLTVGQIVLLGLVTAHGVEVAIHTGGLDRTPSNCSVCASIDAALPAVPDGADVAAEVYILPHLVDRARPRMAMPDWLDQTGRPLDPDWVILNRASSANGNPENHWEAETADRLRQLGYQTAYEDGPIVVLHR
jgi:uncharacterized membrane protein